MKKMHIIDDNFLKEVIKTKGNNLITIKDEINQNNIDEYIKTKNWFIIKFLIDNFELNIKQKKSILNFYDFKDLKEKIYSTFTLNDFFKYNINFPYTYQITKEDYLNNKKNFISFFNKNYDENHGVIEKIASFFNEQDIDNMNDNEIKIFLSSIIHKITEKNKVKIYNYSAKNPISINLIYKYPFDENNDNDKKLIFSALLNSNLYWASDYLYKIPNYEKLINWEEFFDKTKELPNNLDVKFLTPKLKNKLFDNILENNKYNSISNVSNNITEKNANILLTNENIEKLYKSFNLYDKKNKQYIEKDSHKMSIEVFVYAKLLEHVTHLCKINKYNKDDIKFANNIIQTLLSINGYCSSKNCLHNEYQENNEMIFFTIINFLEQALNLSFEDSLIGMSIPKNEYNSLSFYNLDKKIDKKILVSLLKLTKYDAQDFLQKQFDYYNQEGSNVDKLILSSFKFNFELDETTIKKEKEKINKLTAKEFIDSKDFTLFFHLNKDTVNDLIENHSNIIELLFDFYSRTSVVSFILDKTNNLPYEYLIKYISRNNSNKEILDKYFNLYPIDAKNIDSLTQTQKNILLSLQKENLMQYIINPQSLDEYSINNVKQEIFKIDEKKIILQEFLDKIKTKNIKDDDDKDYKNVTDELNKLLKINKLSNLNNLEVYNKILTFKNSLTEKEKNVVYKTKIELINYNNDNLNKLSVDQYDKLLTILLNEKQYVYINYLLSHKRFDNELLFFSAEISKMSEKEFLKEIKNPLFKNIFFILSNSHSSNLHLSTIPKLSKDGFNEYIKEISFDDFNNIEKHNLLKLVCNGNQNNSEHLVDYFIKKDRNALMSFYSLKAKNGVIDYISTDQLISLTNKNFKKEKFYFPFTDTNDRLCEFLMGNFNGDDKYNYNIDLSTAEKLKNKHIQYLNEIKNKAPHLYLLPAVYKNYELIANKLYDKDKDNSREYAPHIYFTKNIDYNALNYSLNSLFDNLLNNQNETFYSNAKKNIINVVQSLFWSMYYESRDEKTGSFDIKHCELNINDIKTIISPIVMNACSFLLESRVPEIKNAFYSYVNDLFIENEQTKIDKFYDSFFYRNIKSEYFSIHENELNSIIKIIDLAAFNKNTCFIEKLIVDWEVFKTDEYFLQKNIFSEIKQSKEVQDFFPRLEARIENIFLQYNLNKNILAEKVEKKKNKI